MTSTIIRDAKAILSDFFAIIMMSPPYYSGTT